MCLIIIKIISKTGSKIILISFNTKYNFLLISLDFGIKCDPDWSIKKRYGLPPSAQFNASRGLFVRLSVCVYVAGVCSRIQSRSVESDEVFIESSTSQPRFLEPHGAREEELALSCSQAAPPRCLHTTRPPAAPAPPAAGHKHTALLTVHVTQRQHHWRLTFILLLLHVMNTAAHHWEKEQQQWQRFTIIYRIKVTFF